jgi:hypothetical protein
MTFTYYFNHVQYLSGSQLAENGSTTVRSLRWEEKLGAEEVFVHCKKYQPKIN